MELSQRLKLFRAEKKLTQKDIADKTGIHPVTIRKYETNKMEPKILHIEKIAKALDISSIALLGTNNITLKIDTLGDLYNLIFSLSKAQILQVEINNKNVYFSLNDKLTKYFNKADSSENRETPKFKIEDKNESLIKWAQLFLESKDTSFYKQSEEKQQEILDQIEQIEIQLMSLESSL